MKKRRLILLVFGSITAFVITILIWPGEREPEYQGKKLSWWIRAYRESESNSPKNNEAITALKNIGSNGIPAMVEWLRYKPSPVRRQLMRLSGEFNNQSFASWAIQKSRRATDAMITLHLLGPGAKASIPDLEQMIRDTYNPVSTRATSALSSLGREALSSLLKAAADPTCPNRSQIIYFIPHIRNLDTNGDVAVAVLTGCLHDRDREVTLAALSALGDLGRRPEIVVPILTECLTNTDWAIRERAGNALYGFGTNALAAVPALLNALDDQNSSVRLAAEETLQKISPQQLELDRQTRKHDPPKVVRPID